MNDFPETVNSAGSSTEAVRVLYEDEHFLFVHKPAGVLVHRLANLVPRADETILTDWLLAHYPEVRNVGDEPVLRPGIVHRLDRDTSGVMVVARSQQSFAYLKNLFQRHEVEKTYLSLVFGEPSSPSGVIDTAIALKRGSLRRATRGKNLRLPKEARTEYRTVARYEFRGTALTFLAVTPKTGRTHQIRVHLSSVGCPVVGDKIYGVTQERLRFAASLGVERQFLHADTIEFTDEEGKRLRVSDDLPLTLSRALGQLSPVGEDHPRSS